MSSAAKTPNLGLPQWVTGEKPERADFNAAFLAIDAAAGSKTTETIIGTWCGHVLYAKTISYGTFANASVAHGITSPTRVMIDFSKSYVLAYSIWFPLMASATDSSGNINNWFTSADSTKINIACGSNIGKANFSAFITLNYTKD